MAKEFDKKISEKIQVTTTGQRTMTVNQTTNISWLNFVAGLWLIASPFVLGYSGTIAATNDMIVGVIVGIVALIGRSMTQTQRSLVNAVNIIAGLWLIAAPSVLTYGSSVASTNDIILGIIIILVAAWSILSARKE